jgi:transposase
MRPKPERHWLKTVPGMGDILAWTILLETGPMARFPSAGAWASDCRGVKSPRRSHGQVQGQGNTKNGTKDLGWAVVEAAHVAMRFAPGITRFAQRQPVTRHQLVALKTVTHKGARACADSRRDQVPVARAQAFGRERAAPHGWGRERINRVGGQPEVLLSHTPSRTSIAGVGAPCVMPPPLP